MLSEKHKILGKINMISIYLKIIKLAYLNDKV